MFGWEFPPFNSGGLGTACYGLTRSLARQGAEVVFVLPKKLPVASDLVNFCFAEDFYSKAAANIKKSQIKYKELELLLHPYMDEALYKEKYRELQRMGLSQNASCASAPNLYSEVLRYGELAREVAKNEEFDIIHSHDWLSSLAGIEAKKVSKKPLVLHIHATEFDRSGGNGVNERVYAIEKKGMQHANKVVAVSNYTKDIVVNKYNVEHQKVAVVHNGIDQDYFPNYDKQENNLEILKKSGKKIVLFLGRITLQKGLDYFLKAAKRVLEYDPKVVFLVAGSGDAEKEMIDLTARMGISDKVLFTGFLRGKEVMLAYRSADLYVMPSVSEPFGINVLESMINETPVLVSKQSGASEVVRNILKVDFWDIEELTNKILAVLKYKSLKHCLSREAQKEVKSLGWDKAASKCLNLYQKLILES